MRYRCEKIKGPRKERYNTLRLLEIIGIVSERIENDPQINNAMDKAGIPAKPTRNRKKLVERITKKAIRTLFAVISEKVREEHVFVSIMNFGVFSPKFIKRKKSNTIVTRIGFARYAKGEKYKRQHDTLRLPEITKIVFKQIKNSPQVIEAMEIAKVPAKPIRNRSQLVRKINKKAIRTLFAVISEKVREEHVFVSIMNFGTFSPRLIKKAKSNTIVTRIGFARYVRRKKERSQ